MKSVKEKPTNKTHSDQPSERYNPKNLEKHWQKYWAEIGLDRTPQPEKDQKRFYALSMFPYPSGSLHMGHVRNYVITDVIARLHRMRGYAVLHPMGWDAFGLPAENAAIDRGIMPEDWTNQNILQMKSQLNKLGLSIDWDREQATCHKEYYKWTQYLFLELYKAGLAYQKEATVNWDPVDQTVLANEQVDSEGNSWRSGAKVEQRKLKQWFLRITKYSEQLLNDLDELNGWPDKVKTMQANWIGRYKGTQISFALSINKNESIKVFTTRPDTLYGVSYIAIKADHKILDQITDNDQIQKINNFRHQLAKRKAYKRDYSDKEMLGIKIDLEAINPINGQKVPIWLANYVLAEYGTGAVMGVPAHDERDFKFANKYNINITKVIVSEDTSDGDNPCFTGEGKLINSDHLNGKDSNEARNLIVEFGEKDGWAEIKQKYRLRDWLISRQRYWGCPIPIIHCKECGVVPVKTEDLPVELPKEIDIKQKGESPLRSNRNWSSVKCPKCNKKAIRESDTMDTFMCSSWYFLRFADPTNNNLPYSKGFIDSWLPVNQYVGGIEHAILHLLYSRFLTKSLKDIGLHSISEPFSRLLTQGMVQGITYKNPKTGKYIPIAKITNPSNPTDPDTKDHLITTYEKMSKSKYNGIDPASVIDKYGADTARMFILFKAPPEKDLEWNDADVEGQYRFLTRIWKLVDSVCTKISKDKDYLSTSKSDSILVKDLNKNEVSVRRSIHSAIKSITEDLDINLQFNTAISELMKLTNAINEHFDLLGIPILKEGTTTLIKLLAPFAPHISEELWQKFSNTESVHLVNWPDYDPEAIISQTVQLVVQVKGKVRGKLEISLNMSNTEIEKIALESDIAKKWLEGSKPSRVIIIPNKLVNLVP